MEREVLENFVLGVHADSKDASSDFQTPERAVNLRTDRYGFLIARQPVSEFLSANSGITGLAVVGDLIFYVSSEQLYVSIRGRTAQVVQGVDDLSGRISMVKDYEAYVVIADEFGHAYKVHISDTDEVEAELLSLLAPIDSTFVDTLVPLADSIALTTDHNYKFQYLSDDGHYSPLTEKQTPTQLPSLSSPTTGRTYQITVYFPAQTWDVLKKVNTVLVYRSAPNEDDDYRLVQTVRRPTGNDPETVSVTFNDTTSAADRADGAVPVDSTPYPEEATSVVYYNGLLYATCKTSIRWCNLESGTPQTWNWPARNSVQRREVNFAIAVGNVLLFGDSQNTWSMTRDGPLPYIRYVGGRGALDTHATSLLEQGWGFVSEDGFYIGDSQSFQKVSEPIEREWTKDGQTIVQGAVTQIPNRDIHFAAELESESKIQYVAEIRGDGLVWNEWQDTAAVQSAVMSQDERIGGLVVDSDEMAVADSDNQAVTTRIPGSAASSVYFIDGSRHVKELAWHDQKPDIESKCTWYSHKMYLRNRAPGLPEKRWRNIIVQGSGGLKLIVYTEAGDSQYWVTTLADAPTRFSIRRISKWMQFTLEFYGSTTVESIVVEYDILKARLRSY